jgi:hypothetical protein
MELHKISESGKNIKLIKKCGEVFVQRNNVCRETKCVHACVCVCVRVCVCVCVCVRESRRSSWGEWDI